MKCVRCGNDAKRKERENRTCPKCHGRFAFEPREGDPLTDQAFKTALERVSSNGRVRFGFENLYYEVCRTLRPKRMRKPAGCAIATLVLFLAASAIPSKAAPVKVLLFVGSGIGIVALVMDRWRHQHTVAIPVDRFDQLAARWKEAHSDLEGVIVRQQRKRTRELESDIGDYSFDRAVICDRARTVDLLLANNFHFENNCAVLSVGGYPESVFPTVLAMLKRNPKLHVFALHDASPDGCRLAHRLAHDERWFRGHVAVVDVGLRPPQAAPFDGLFVKASEPVAPGQGISNDEAAWLSRYTLELAAIRPEQLLKRLYKAVNRRATEERKSDVDAWVDYDDTSFSADASASEGAADGFG